MKDFFYNRQNRIITYLVGVLLFVGIGSGVLLYIFTDFFESREVLEEDSDRITLLCLGIDKQVAMNERHPETNSIGQADGIFLISIEPKMGEVNIVVIPRDTIVRIEKYNRNLEYSGSEEAQICLQYAHADGMQLSSEVTVERVEELFPDTKIDGYISVNIEAVMEINDAIGGVEVTVDDEYTASLMGVSAGTTLNLVGENTMLYLRLRDIGVTGSAYTRLDRIKEYMLKAIPKGLETVKETPDLVIDMYETLEENMVTNMKVEDVVELLLSLKDISMENVQIHIIQGEITVGADGYEEFYPEEACMEMLREKMSNSQ